MWITIFNANESKVHKKREGQMVWSVILFADDIIWSSAHSFLSCQRNYFKYCLERSKVNMVKAYLKFWKTEVTPEQLEKDYQNYIRIKKKKNKSKLDLKAIAKSQVYFKTVEKVMMNFIDTNEKDLGITELAPFMNIYRSPGRKEIEVIALAGFVPHGPNLKREETDVDLIVDITSTGFEIPLHSCEIESLLSFKEFDTKIKKDFFAKGKTNAIRELFLELVSPVSLTSKQVQIIRNELNEKFKEVKDAVGEFNNDFIEKKLKTDNPKEINARFTEKLIPCITEFQKAIDNNIYMIQLKNKEDNPKIYKLYLVLTTLRNIVGLYEKLNIINQGSAVYVRDELQQKGVLDVLKFFLYLKVEG